MKKNIIIILLLLLSNALSFAMDGSLDTTGYDAGGTQPGTTRRNQGTGTQINATYIQNDGKIVVVGQTNTTSQMFVARYTTAGALDTTFNPSGSPAGTLILPLIATSNGDVAYAVAVQSDLKIVIAGTTLLAARTPAANMVVIRLNTDGSFDTSFGVNGVFVTPKFGNPGPQSQHVGDVAQAVVIEEDGKIVVVGYSDANSDLTTFAVARYTTSGALDTTGFNAPYGFLQTNPLPDDAQNTANGLYTVALQANGYIVGGGASYFVGGAFPENVEQFDEDINSISRQGQGPFDFALARYTPSGVLDTSFSGGIAEFGNIPGTVLTDFDPLPPVYNGTTYSQGQALNIQPNGQIILAGLGTYNGTNQNTVMIARYNSDGSLDTSFGGPVTAAPLTFINGTVITSSSGGTSNTRIDQAYGLALQYDGKIVIGGITNLGGGSSYSYLLARYLSTGALDTTFNGGGAPLGMVFTTFTAGISSGISSIALQQNGYIVGAGSPFTAGITSNFFTTARYIVGTSLTTTTLTSPSNGQITGPFPVFAGAAQNPGIVDIFVDNVLFVSTVTTGAVNSFSVMAPTPLALGAHTVYAVNRYHDDGHVNLPTTPIPFEVGCAATTDPLVNLINSLYPCLYL